MKPEDEARLLALTRFVNAALKNALEAALLIAYPEGVTGSIALIAEFEGTIGPDSLPGSYRMSYPRQLEIANGAATPTKHE